MNSAPISQTPSCQLNGSSGKALHFSQSAMSINRHFSKFTSSYTFPLFQLLKNYDLTLGSKVFSIYTVSMTTS